MAKDNQLHAKKITFSIKSPLIRLFPPMAPIGIRKGYPFFLANKSPDGIRNQKRGKAHILGYF
jgi:hypothetical protein